jgi:ketosteroid isomerase-like protein
VIRRPEYGAWLAASVFLATIQNPPDVALDQALDSLVAAERAFAKATAELGVRDGFLTFFAPDAMEVEPAGDRSKARLINAREAYAGLPPQQRPLRTRLEWEPRFGDVSGAGDLGYLTGPYVRSDSKGERPTDYGLYFSLWRRQGDGTWKVIVDIGTPTDGPIVLGKPGQFERAPQAGPPSAASVDLELADAEFGAAASGDPAAAYGRVLDSTARLYRPGQPPLLGRAAIEQWAARALTALGSTRLYAAAAGSRDLGFTLSGYTATSPAGKAEHGTSLRVWKWTGGRWRVVHELMRPAPDAKPPG